MNPWQNRVKCCGFLIPFEWPSSGILRAWLVQREIRACSSNIWSNNPLNDQNKSFVVYCNNRLTPSPYSTLFLFACHSCLTWHSWSSWTREYCRYLCTVVNINAGHFIRSLENYTFWICNMYHNFVITIVIYILSNDSYYSILHEYASILKEEKNCETMAELPQFIDMIFWRMFYSIYYKYCLQMILW